jgi:hypothetical protein
MVLLSLFTAEIFSNTKIENASALKSPTKLTKQKLVLSSSRNNQKIVICNDVLVTVKGTTLELGWGALGLVDLSSLFDTFVWYGLKPCLLSPFFWPCVSFFHVRD